MTAIAADLIWRLVWFLPQLVVGLGAFGIFTWDQRGPAGMTAPRIWLSAMARQVEPCRRHTGRTDLPSRRTARRRPRVRSELSGGGLVLCSPLLRARRHAAGRLTPARSTTTSWNGTRRVGGPHDGADRADLADPGWLVWITRAAGQHPGEQWTGGRARRASSAAAVPCSTTVATASWWRTVVLRILTARWLGLPPIDGRLFSSTRRGCRRSASSTRPVIRCWNATSADRALTVGSAAHAAAGEDAPMAKPDARRAASPDDTLRRQLRFALPQAFAAVMMAVAAGVRLWPSARTLTAVLILVTLLIVGAGVFTWTRLRDPGTSRP